MKQKTAVLLFANSAKFEAEQKPFEHAELLFNTLSQQTLKVIKQSGLPYCIVSEKQQVGNSFGQRFTNAIQHVFNKGFTNVITIGNDTPHLTHKHIKNACQKLQNTPLVFGPSTDGGFYLMGLHKSVFNSKTFKALPWQSAALRSATLQLFQYKNVKAQWLEPLSDVDSADDITTVLHQFKSLSKRIKTQLILSCSSKKTVLNCILHYHYSVITSVVFNKGSPSF